MTAQNKIFFNSFTVEHVSLSSFASVSFVPARVKRPNRRNTVTVGNPVALIARKDGHFTIRGSKKADTRTVNLRGGVLRTVDHFGVVTDYEV